MRESARRPAGRVTMPRMVPAMAAVALIFAPACSPDEAATDDGSGREALAAVAELSRELDGLNETLRQERSDAADALDALERDLRKSIKDLRASLRNLRAGNADAESDAASALARASEVASDLEVLEDRYNFHLRRYHGGG
jgi:septal ring factor EnvC (AmiA/AmiB activator)